jgi:hypothetical protein
MSWFWELFGFRESVSSVQANFTVEEFETHATLTSKVNNRSFNAGLFSLRNTASFPGLRETPSAVPGSLHIIRGGTAATRALTEVLASQSLPEFDGATFQAASNFNCLEFVGPDQCAGDGVTNYIYDYTQGPYCALATGAALVYRNYFIRQAGGIVGQLEKEVELLARTPIAPHVEHGYPLLGGPTLAALAAADWSDLSQFDVGLHENCEVTTGADLAVSAVPTGRIVHHVYAAAFNYNGTVEGNEVSRRIGAQMLAAEYQATVLAAWEMSRKYPGRAGSNRLLLTALGGGVFGNPRKMIIEAVASAKEIIRESGLQVYFVCFDERSYQKSVDAGLNALVEELGGHVVTQISEL